MGQASRGRIDGGRRVSRDQWADRNATIALGDLARSGRASYANEEGSTMSEISAERVDGAHTDIAQSGTADPPDADRNWADGA